MIWISHEKGTQYNKEILKQQDYTSVTLPFKRGEIVDSKGVKLAVSEKYYNLVIDASVINYDEKYVEPSKKYANLVVPEGGKNFVALDMIIDRIQRHLNETAERS